MELTRKQEEGLKIAIQRFNNGDRYTCISGYAGTGKSTLVKFIIDALPGIRPDEDVKYVAYTGKAANILKNKGCPGATTAHKLLYSARMLPSGRYSFTPKNILDDNPSVIVVDEVSMLPKKMWDLLCTHNVYILACGDPEQLPPIADENGEDPNNHVLDNPHIFLDEIMRQAAESEIIRFSMHIREGKPLYEYHCDEQEVKFVTKVDCSSDVFMWGDQVLCATNNTANNINKQMRAYLGRFGNPQIGDKVINRHNEWEFLSNKENPLTNGVIGNIVNNVQLVNKEYPSWIRGVYGSTFSIPVYTFDMTGDEDDEIFQYIMIDAEMINGRPESLSGREKFKIINRLKDMAPFSFTYGYGITVWKAQGSEWDKVVLMNEGWPTDRELHRRYLYTGITRARNKLVVVV